MFTIEAIKAAHAKVKSGADFPAYIQEIKQLGVQSYDAWVADGHIDYNGVNNYQASAPAKYEPLTVADESNIEQFKKDLKTHQQGGSNYLTFCQQSAAAGVEKWTVNLAAMTCIYFDKAGNEMLAERIPGN